MLVTIIPMRMVQNAGEAELLFAAIILTVMILIFSEVTPKTFAALHPEVIAYPAAFIYAILLKFSYPFVWIISIASRGMLKLLNK
jgi:Mg2+/Co2+ transporter CorB